MADTQWLDHHEQETWLSMRALSKQLDTALDRQLQRDAGLSHITYEILTVLSHRPERTMSMTTLANLTASSQSRMSHAVARLEERGWVSRARPESSRRTVHATLTDSGFAVLAAAAPGHVAEVRRLVFDRLTAEQVKQLYAVNTIILEALSDDGFPEYRKG